MAEVKENKKAEEGNHQDSQIDNSYQKSIQEQEIEKAEAQAKIVASYNLKKRIQKDEILNKKLNKAFSESH